MNNTRFTIFSLSTNQGIMLISIKVMSMVANLLSLQLMTNTHLATLPLAVAISTGIVGALLAPILFDYWSRKVGHLIGISISLVGFAMSIVAIEAKSFVIFVIAAVLIGISIGFARYYAYTAADTVGNDKKSMAIAYIVSAGVVSAIIAPIIAEKTVHLLSLPFMATYIALFVLNVLGMLLLAVTKLKTAPMEVDEMHLASGRKVMLLNYPFIIGSLATGVCYLIMTQVMTATPLAMAIIYHLPFSNIAVAMQLHFLGMFTPSLISGRLVKYFGVRVLLLIGIVLYLLCTYILVSGQTVWHFYIGSLLLGVGWNFIFISGSSVIAKICTTKTRNFIQGTNTIITSVFNAVGSLLAGPLLFALGWSKLNLTVLPFSAILLGITIIAWYRHEQFR